MIYILKTESVKRDYKFTLKYIIFQSNPAICKDSIPEHHHRTSLRCKVKKYMLMTKMRNMEIIIQYPEINDVTVFHYLQQFGGTGCSSEGLAGSLKPWEYWYCQK